METLLFLAPMMEIVGSGILIVAGAVFLVLGAAVLFAHIEEDEKLVRRLVAAKPFRTLAIALFAGLVFAGLGQSFDGYKNVLIYRAINSTTTEKSIENINKLIDYLGDKAGE